MLRGKDFSGCAGPFFTVKEAAQYCSFSEDHFRRLSKEYMIKRYGPSRNKFARADLDSWMANPNYFILEGCNHQKRITKVEV